MAEDEKAVQAADGAKTQEKARICMIIGSPRKANSVKLGGLVEQGILEAGGACDVFALYQHPIIGCDSCDACLKTGKCIKTERHLDDFGMLEDMLAKADLLAIVAPVYFAGPPSQLKALYDRFQPFWSRRYMMGMPAPKKRPAVMFVMGAGGDPFGYEPLLTISRSALNNAGWLLTDVHDFIGFQRNTHPLRMEADAIRIGRALVEKVDREKADAASATDAAPSAPASES